MEAPERGALMLVRIVAAALIGWAIVDVALYVAVCRHKALPVEFGVCMLKSISLIIGLGVLLKSRALAEWISEKLDL